jgi:hypothetical protein
MSKAEITSLIRIPGFINPSKLGTKELLLNMAHKNLTLPGKAHTVHTGQHIDRMLHILGRTKQDDKFLSLYLNSMRFKIYELFISGIFHLEFLEHN